MSAKQTPTVSCDGCGEIVREGVGAFRSVHEARHFMAVHRGWRYVPAPVKSGAGQWPYEDWCPECFARSEQALS